jgi:hypothetical protein
MAAPNIRYFTIFMLFLSISNLRAQVETEQPADRPVRSIFQSVLLIDNQSVVVPIKGTFEFDILHRFGTFRNGFDDLYGFYATSNIRLGLNYAPIENLYVGAGLTKFKHLLDFNIKYALLKQMQSDKMPVSVSYYGNMVIDLRPEENRAEVYNSTDRYSYFHQIIIARKFFDWLSLQIAPSISHYNIVDTYLNHDHIAIAAGGWIKVSPSMGLIFGIDQPITRHDQRNPNPNISLGIEIATSSHTFQVFFGNYGNILPQENNFFNRRNYADGIRDFALGFNITRLWNF